MLFITCLLLLEYKHLKAGLLKSLLFTSIFLVPLTDLGIDRISVNILGINE